MTKILNPIELRRERIAKPRPVCLAACTPTLLLCKSMFLTIKLKLLKKKKSSLTDAGISFSNLFCICITKFISIFLRLERRRKGTRPAWPASLTKASPQTMSSENRKLVRIFVIKKIKFQYLTLSRAKFTVYQWWDLKLYRVAILVADTPPMQLHRSNPIYTTPTLYNPICVLYFVQSPHL